MANGAEALGDKMGLRGRIEGLYQRHVTDFAALKEFRALEKGTATLEAFDVFVANVVRSHLKSPQMVAFLYALAPPEVAGNFLRNMLEELGIEGEDGISHPSMLRELAKGAGLGPMLPELEERAAGDIRQIVVEPLLYGTLKEVGFAAMCEIVSFEYMLSRTARRIATALAAHRGLSAETLEWFNHHAEVDIDHAEQGLDGLVAYTEYYEFSEEGAFTIAEMALRENVFIKRYFGELALGRFANAIEY